MQCFTDDQLAAGLEAVISACDRDVSPKARQRLTRLIEVRAIFIAATRRDHLADVREAPHGHRDPADPFDGR